VPSLPDAIPIDQIAHNLSQSEDPHTALMEYINTVLTHAQMLPYFGQRTVKPQHIKDVSEATTHQGCEVHQLTTDKTASSLEVGTSPQIRRPTDRS